MLLWCVVIMLQYFSTASVAAGRRLRLLNYNPICTQTPIVYLKQLLEFNGSASIAIKDYIDNVIIHETRIILLKSREQVILS